MYRLIFEKRALKSLNNLEENTKKRIWNKLQECKKNPFRFLEPLVQIKGFKLHDMEDFKRFFEEKDFQDTTYSYKYTNQLKDNFKFAVFFEPQQSINDKIEEFIKNKYPKKFIHFKTIIGSIEDENNKIHYNQIGLTFSSKNSVGCLCVYYSPSMGDKEK